jgi:hypothetical protein
MFPVFLLNEKVKEIGRSGKSNEKQQEKLPRMGTGRKSLLATAETQMCLVFSKRFCQRMYSC